MAEKHNMGKKEENGSQRRVFYTPFGGGGPTLIERPCQKFKDPEKGAVAASEGVCGPGGLENALAGRLGRFFAPKLTVCLTRRRQTETRKTAFVR